MGESTRAEWIEGMIDAITRCAPVVVGTLARCRAGFPQAVDAVAVAGRVMLEVAEAAYNEGWDDEELRRKAEAKTMECIGVGLEEDMLIPLDYDPEPPRNVEELRREVLTAVSQLNTLQLRVLALILQEGLSVAETAAVLNLPEWRVHQECAQAVCQIRRRVYGSGAFAAQGDLAKEP